MPQQWNQPFIIKLLLLVQKTVCLRKKEELEARLRDAKHLLDHQFNRVKKNG